MPTSFRGEPVFPRARVLLTGFAFLAVAVWATSLLLSGLAGHLLGNAATICASSAWQPWTAGGPATTGFSLSPFGLVCTYPHFSDGSPIRVYPDEPTGSRLVVILVLSTIGAWLLLGGHYRAKSAKQTRIRKRFLRGAGVISSVIFVVAGLLALGMMYAYSKNGMVSSCLEFANQPIGSIENGVPESSFGQITIVHSVIPTGVLCTFPSATGDTGLVLFGAGEFAGAGGVSVVAFVAAIIAFFLASRSCTELTLSPPTSRPDRR